LCGLVDCADDRNVGEGAREDTADPPGTKEKLVVSALGRDDVTNEGLTQYIQY